MVSAVDEAAAVIRDHADCMWYVPSDGRGPKWSCGTRHAATSRPEHTAMLVLDVLVQTARSAESRLSKDDKNVIFAAFRAGGVEGVFNAVECLLDAQRNTV